MDEKTLERFHEWERRADDVAVRRELAAMAGDEKTLENRFYKHLEFGTGGLRGVVGAGTKL